MMNVCRTFLWSHFYFHSREVRVSFVKHVYPYFVFPFGRMEAAARFIIIWFRKAQRHTCIIVIHVGLDGVRGAKQPLYIAWLYRDDGRLSARVGISLAGARRRSLVSICSGLFCFDVLPEDNFRWRPATALDPAIARRTLAIYTTDKMKFI